MSKANVYQQRPEPGVHAESPLHHAELHKLAGKTAAKAGIVLREKKLLGHLVLRGLELPVALTLVASGETSLQWLAPDEWLLIVPGGEEYAVEQRLRQALGEELHYAVVNVSGGQTLLELSGANVRELLMKSTSYDVHPSNFPVGKAVGSIFAKSQCVIRHTGEDTWELVVRRSFADYFWLWLQDASAEYGLQVAA